MEHTGESYALPLDDVLQVLQTVGKTYRLWTALPASLLPFTTRRGEAFEAEVVVTSGQVRSCVIRDQVRGRRLEGASAFAAVRSREQLVWIVQPIQGPEPALVCSEAVPSAFFPLLALPWVARSAPVRAGEEPVALAHLTRRQRQIWLLIDGRRTVQEIASLLGISLEELDQELTTLERKGLITSGRVQQGRR